VSGISSVGIFVADIGLQEVQSILRAIHTADAQTAASLPSNPVPLEVDGYGLRREAIGSELCYLPRQVIHPTPRYLPRPVLHPTPRVESSPATVAPPCPKACVPHIIAGPQPPWKMQPWQEPRPPADVIKMIVRPPDIVTKGTLIDLFL